MKKLLIIIITLNFSLITVLFGQEVKTSNCLLLEKLLKEDIVQKYFHLSSFDGELIAFVDSGGFFNDCIIQNINNKKVKIVHVLNKDINEKKILVIEIFNVILVKHNTYKIYIGQKMTQKYGFVIIKKKKGKYLLKKHHLGQC